MGQTLTNGLYLPDEGERNCYSGLESNWRALDAVIGGYNTHIANLDIHVTAADKNGWNGHVANGDIHVTAADKNGWNNHVGNSDIHVTAEDKQTWDAVTGKADASALTAHTGNTTIHVTAADKQTWDAVTGKADDSGVVHKAGAETIAGPKTFSDTVTVPSINGINPGSLSMPDLTAGVDISGYFTTGTTENTYTPPVNGWVSIMGMAASGQAGIYVENSKGFYASANSMIAFTGTNRYVNLCFPVIGGESYNIVLKSVTTSIAAKFFPCQGNV